MHKAKKGCRITNRVVTLKDEKEKERGSAHTLSMWRSNMRVEYTMDIGHKSHGDNNKV